MRDAANIVQGFCCARRYKVSILLARCPAPVHGVTLPLHSQVYLSSRRFDPKFRDNPVRQQPQESVAIEQH
jgi:hypothetical protein